MEEIVKVCVRTLWRVMFRSLLELEKVGMVGMVGGSLPPEAVAPATCNFCLMQF